MEVRTVENCELSTCTSKTKDRLKNFNEKKAFRNGVHCLDRVQKNLGHNVKY